MQHTIVEVSDIMQSGYRYTLVEPMGKNFDPAFAPELTPKEMLRLGVFGGKYMTDCAYEFPADWYAKAKLCPERHDPKLNYFGVNASQPLSVWRAKGSTSTIRADGSNGIAAIIWGGVCLMKIRSRFADGRPSGGISRRCGRIALRAMQPADLGNGKLFCIGRMTLGNYNKTPCCRRSVF